MYDNISQGMTDPVMASSTTNADYTAKTVQWIVVTPAGWTGRAKFVGKNLWWSNDADFSGTTNFTAIPSQEIPGPFERVITASGSARLVLQG